MSQADGTFSITSHGWSHQLHTGPTSKVIDKINYWEVCWSQPRKNKNEKLFELKILYRDATDPGGPEMQIVLKAVLTFLLVPLIQQ